MVDFQLPLPGLARDFNKLTKQEKDFIAYFSAIDIQPAHNTFNTLRKRLGPAGFVEFHKRFFIAASVYDQNAILPMLDELKARYPDLPFAYITLDRGYDAIERTFGLVKENRYRMGQTNFYKGLDNVTIHAVEHDIVLTQDIIFDYLTTGKKSPVLNLNY